ncbi:MAG: type I pantothenate kinase [Burkholderiales bacterium]|nr:type I pantothenate kinase [Rhodocyclaceae bacterium]
MDQQLHDVIKSIAAAVPTHGGTPLVVGLAGSVAAGKSTLAGKLADGWRDLGRRVEVVSTDGFLHPNRILQKRGLLLRKGFPESYDHHAFSAFLDAVWRDGKHGGKVVVPTYSHQTYDVSFDAGREIAPSDILVVEGINALQPAFTAGKLDISIYLDAVETDLFDWYYERGTRLREAAKYDPTSFFVRYLSLSDAEWDAQLKAFWNDINLPNLYQHIAPTRQLADYVLHKTRGHTLSVVRTPSSSDNAVAS